MLVIFWDTKEAPAAKKKIAKQFGELEKDIKLGNKKVAKVVFTDARSIRKLNKTYRKLDK